MPKAKKPKPVVERWLPLETRRLILRDVRASDFDDIHEYATDPEVIRYMFWGPNTPAVTRKVLDGWLKEQQRWPRRSVSMAAEHRADGKMIGAVRLWVTDAKAGTGELGYSFNSRYWGRGLATEAARALIAVAFERMGLRRVIATCDTRNVGSWTVMERVGMRREATFKQDLKARDGWRDSYLYAVLAEEWRRRKG
jgi:ribosomal-protein-alanine N-acetyltransferase